MHSRFTAHLCVAGFVAMGAVAGAQAGSQPSASAAGQAGQATITGCVVSESDYRKMHDAGKGGVVGTGVGAADNCTPDTWTHRASTRAATSCTAECA